MATTLFHNPVQLSDNDLCCFTERLTGQATRAFRLLEIVSREDCYKHNIKPEKRKADMDLILRSNKVPLIWGTGGKISLFSGKI